jgi:hypothetical protein
VDAGVFKVIPRYDENQDSDRLHWWEMLVAVGPLPSGKTEAYVVIER